jgi:hypothetical protein
MWRFARLVAAVFCFPLVWALCLTFVDAVCLASGESGAFFSAESVALFAGLASFLLFCKVLPDQTRMYVLGHELTHAVWGMAFGARVSGLKVRSTGGSVTLTKSNVWITLAPYFFPFWTFVVALAALSVRAVMYFACPDAPFPLPWLWMFAVGFTWCFHVCFTIRSLMQTQPDVQEYGRVFSWTFILACNIIGIIVWMLCATDVSVKALAGSLASHASSAYRNTFHLLGGCLEVFVDGMRNLLS